MPAPDLYWWHIQQDLSVDDGVKRARQIMNLIPAPPHKRAPGAMHDLDVNDEGRVRLITSDFRAIIKCLPQGAGKVLTIIIVAGQDDQRTRRVMEMAREGMRSGNLNDFLE